MRMLFVSGCARSGTTAFSDYLNQHPELMVCRERYKYVADKVTPDFFTFDRILDYEPRHSQGESNMPWEYHAELVARKDIAELSWIGDKYPGYVRSLVALLGNNPGVRFIFMYRPLEEVAESYEARSRNPEDPWLGGRDGFELSIHHWNRAMRNIRDFVEGGLEPEVLLVSYHDFFGDSESYIPLLSRFLEIEFDESIRQGWKETSSGFESSRRRKDVLNEEQLTSLEERKDGAAEKWVLDRIQRQWTDPRLYMRDGVKLSGPAPATVQDPEASNTVQTGQQRASFDQLARSFKARGQRIDELERDLQKRKDAKGTVQENRKAAQEAKALRKKNARLEKENRILATQVDDLERQLTTVRSSRSWRLLTGLDQVRLALLDKGRKTLGRLIR